MLACAVVLARASQVIGEEAFCHEFLEGLERVDGTPGS
jgi:hypothetical protein